MVHSRGCAVALGKDADTARGQMTAPEAQDARCKMVCKRAVERGEPVGLGGP
jgi:hypothetical protein